MTSRYFFNVIKADGMTADLEGTELASLDAARKEAIKDARILMSYAILDGLDVSSRRIEICDEHGNILLKLPFRDTITPSG